MNKKTLHIVAHTLMVSIILMVVGINVHYHTCNSTNDVSVGIFNKVECNHDTYVEQCCSHQSPDMQSIEQSDCCYDMSKMLNSEESFVINKHDIKHNLKSTVIPYRDIKVKIVAKANSILDAFEQKAEEVKNLPIKALIKIIQLKASSNLDEKPRS